MNGVSRFLSRRDKHHEKRASKPSNHKVRPVSTPSSLESLFHTLPSALPSSVQDSLLFLQHKTPCRALLARHLVSTSTSNSSDNPISQSRPSQVPSDLYRIFTNEDSKTTADKEADKKVKMLLSRLQGAGISRMGEEQALHALSWCPDDIDKAYDLLLLANESIEGEVKDYNPRVPMLGAINRNMVTCYLDALLFAMFARLDSFEAMLYDNFDDEPRKKLAGVLRLWVNLLRTGQLIKVELTKHLQDSLAACGWEEAAQMCQQDASEAFTFITGALELPLLTLKMDIYHTGREDKEDDHKFVNERLLEVAIPEQQEGDHVICLEDCLETYFNNRIEVKRYLQRQNTIASIKSREEDFFGKDLEKNETMHVETVELPGCMTPIVATPTSFGPSTPMTPVRPTLEGRRRADSIFSQRLARKTPEASNFDEKRHLEDMLDHSSGGRPRSASLLRKEILMPAWQFFSLIPWYTDNVPQTDAQVAAHFSVKRPVLGICLKRYTMLPNGAPKRLDTYIDIPLEIGLPHFISDDRMKEEGPLFGNFKLVLQSAVCHRGVSVDSGHYIALVRADCNERPSTAQTSEEDSPEAWLRFDDLSNQRVSEVDIKKTLREESPYLLFYQVQPIDEELASRGDPPSYAEAQSGFSSLGPSRETLNSLPSTSPSASSTGPESGGDAEKITPADSNPEKNLLEEALTRQSTSSNRRSSVAFEDADGSIYSALRGRTQPPTPEEQKTGFLSASRRGSRGWTGGGSKSRTSSPSNESRLSLTLSRLTGRASKDKLLSIDTAMEEPVIVIDKVQTLENEHTGPAGAKEKKDGGISRSKSKKEKKDKHRSKSRDHGTSLDKSKGKGKDRPERECAVM
ncbi:cysteine proteinase [Plenodomus tracheiphilus IPT5]|uniref:ubiquitinyl hydrolase 1 n=1 Tax=Plenodomus tracheiphilus IPT5 TaxID=1408161 RepID=A0A6A7BFB5_9PLEO|nr:cysteine proteinase [Plenodomus tracheiphilus IPT5]